MGVVWNSPRATPRRARTRPKTRPMRSVMDEIRKIVKWPYHCLMPMLVRREGITVRFQCEACGATRPKRDDVVYR